MIRRAGIYGPRDYLRIVQEQIRYWKIESLQGLNELGRKAQEKIMGIPGPAQADRRASWRPGAGPRPSASRSCSTANSRWNESAGLPAACSRWRCVAGVRRQGRGPARPRRAATDLPPDQRDAETLGREVFELVDRAVDYRGSHRGRPAADLPPDGHRQPHPDHRPPAGQRRSASRSSPSPSASPTSREIASCRGDSQILEEATLNGGRFTLMCTTSSGAQRPMRVGDPAGR